MYFAEFFSMQDSLVLSETFDFLLKTGSTIQQLLVDFV